MDRDLCSIWEIGAVVVGENIMLKQLDFQTIDFHQFIILFDCSQACRYFSNKLAVF